MCEPTNEPKFKPRDNATLRDESDRTDNPVTIQSDALRWVDDPAHATHLYLVQHDNLDRSQQPFLVLSTLLRPIKRWEPCPHGEHRHRTTHGIWEPGVMERRVE